MGQVGGYLCERTFLHIARGRDLFWILITHGELRELSQKRDACDFSILSLLLRGATARLFE